MPSVRRANSALILAAIKSTCLVANANQPEGIFPFPVSPYYHTTENHISPPQCYTNPVSPELCHTHHVEPTCRMAVLQPPGLSTVSLLVLGTLILRPAITAQILFTVIFEFSRYFRATSTYTTKTHDLGIAKLSTKRSNIFGGSCLTGCITPSPSPQGPNTVNSEHLRSGLPP